MTTESNNTDQTNNENNQQPNTEEVQKPQPEMSLEDALKRLEHLENINKEVIESRDKVKSKLKQFEDEHASQQAKLLEEQGKYKELFESEKSRVQSLEHAYRTTIVDSILDKKLSEIGLAESALGTAKALIDRDAIEFENDSVKEQSVADAIDKLKQNHSVLFNVRNKTPDVKRANETGSNSYLEELRRIQANPHARDAKQQLEQLRIKYGKA